LNLTLLDYAGVPLQTHASVAKAGVDAMSAHICIEEGPRGINSNVIAPGAIAATEGMSRLAKVSGEESSSRSIPSGRWGRAKEIADATVYLFSDAGNYVNGSIVVGKCHVPCAMHHAMDHKLRAFRSANNICQSMEEAGEPRVSLGWISFTPTSSCPIRRSLESKAPRSRPKCNCRRMRLEQNCRNKPDEKRSKMTYIRVG
jgi:hypothetical protein